MFVNNGKIFAGQPLMLLKNLGRHNQFADIVQQACDLHPAAPVFLQTAVPGDGIRNGGHPA